MGNENSTSESQRTSSAQNPASVQPPRDSQNIKRNLEENSRSTDRGALHSTGHRGSCSTSEGAACLDPGIVSLEVTEPSKCPQEARGPEGSSLPCPPVPWEQECPSASMPFTEGPPEGCLASPVAAPEDWPLIQHPRREPSPGAHGEAPTAPVPKGGSSTQGEADAIVPSAGRGRGLDQEGHKSSSSSCTDQLPEVSPVPPQELMKGQLCGKDGQPGGFESQGNEAAGGLPPAESRQGATSVQEALRAPAAAQPGKASSSGLEESPTKPETPTPPDPAPTASDKEKCQAEVPPQAFADDSGFLRACHPTGTAGEAETNSWESCQQQMGAHLVHVELPWDSLSPAPTPGAGDSGKETVGTSDAQGHLQTGGQGSEPSPAVCAAAGNPPEGALLVSTEPSPRALMEETCLASDSASLPAAQASVAAEESSWLTREMVSGAEMPVLTDLAKELADAGLAGQEKLASDLRSEREGLDGNPGEGPAPLPQDDRGEVSIRDQKVQQGVLPPFPASVSDESARNSLGPKEEAMAPESPAVAGEGGKLSEANSWGEEEVPEPLDGGDPENPGGEQPRALGCKPKLEAEKDEVSKLSHDVESKVHSSTDSAQPLRKEGPGHTVRPGPPSEDTARSSVTCGTMGEAHVVHASGSLHKLPEKDLILPPGPDGTGEHILPKEAVWEGPGLQAPCPDTLQDVRGLERMDYFPALESEKSDFLSTPSAEVTPKAQEVESTSDTKMRSHPSAQRPGSCDGDGLLTSPGQPRGLGQEAAGQEVHAEGPHPPEGENLAVDCGLMLSLEQDQQGNLSCLNDDKTQGAASEGPSASSQNHLQPLQSEPEASISDMLGEEPQQCENEKETFPGSPGFKNLDASGIHLPVEPLEVVCLPTHGREEQASRSELQGELPKGSVCDAPSSAPGDRVPESPPTEHPELSAPGGPELSARGQNEQEGACGGSLPSRVSPPTAADASKDSPLAGHSNREESRCAEQGPSKSRQEPADVPKASGRHEEACLSDVGGSEAADARPPLQGLGKTEKASGNTVGTPPCWPDSVALVAAAQGPPAPAPASAQDAPSQDAPDTEVHGEGHAGRPQPAPAPQEEMQPPTASDAGAPRLLGSFPAAEDRGADCGAADTGGNAEEGELGAQGALGVPAEAAPSCGSLQTELQASPGKEASIWALGEPCQAEQLAASSQNDLLAAGELGGVPRSKVDISAAQAVPNPKKLLPPGPPEEAAPDTPYLHIDGAAGKGTGPCPVEEPLLVLGNATSMKLSAGLLAPLSQPGAASGESSAVHASHGSPRPGNLEGPLDSIPYLDRALLLTKSKQVTGEEEEARAPGAGTGPRETLARPASEESIAGEAARELESSRKSVVDPSKDPRRGAPGGVDASSKQISIITGLPDFREHITKIFEKSVLRALTADRPQSAVGEKAGAEGSVRGEDLAGPRPEKPPDGAQGVAMAPLPALPAGLRVDAKEKQELPMEAEIPCLVPQDPAPGKLPGATEQSLPGASVGKEMTGVPQMAQGSEKPEGAGEAKAGPGGLAHSQQGGGQQKLASGPALPAAVQETPMERAADFQVDPQSHREGTSVPEDRIPPETYHQETPTSGSQPGKDGAWAFAHTEGPGDMPVSTSALGASSPRGDVSIVAKAISEPQTPDTLGDEQRCGGGAGISETQNALGKQCGPELQAAEGTATPLEPGSGAAGEAEGDVTLSTADTGARVSSDPPEPGTTRMFCGAAHGLALPGTHGDAGCSAGAPGTEDAAALRGESPAVHRLAEEQPGPELPTPAGSEKPRVSSPPGPDEPQDLKPEHLALGVLPAERRSPGPDPSTLPSVPEKDAPDVPGEAVSDEARSVGGAERSVKRY